MFCFPFHYYFFFFLFCLWTAWKLLLSSGSFCRAVRQRRHCVWVFYFCCKKKLDEANDSGEILYFSVAWPHFFFFSFIEHISSPPNSNSISWTSIYTYTCSKIHAQTTWFYLIILLKAFTFGWDGTQLLTYKMKHYIFFKCPINSSLNFEKPYVCTLYVCQALIYRMIWVNKICSESIQSKNYFHFWPKIMDIQRMCWIYIVIDHLIFQPFTITRELTNHILFSSLLMFLLFYFFSFLVLFFVQSLMGFYTFSISKLFNSLEHWIYYVFI